MARKRKPEKVSKDEAWDAVAASSGGTVIRDRKGKAEHVRFPHHNWVVVLDKYTVSTGNSSATYTRLRALFEPRMAFTFRIRKSNPLDAIGKWLGLQDVHTGRIVLDRDYIVKTDNESMLRSMLMDSRVGGRLESLSKGTFRITKPSVKKPRPKTARELKYEIGGVETDARKLAEMVALMKAALDALKAIGGAAETAVPYEW